ncbi:DUF58 domain-containing protein [Egicoccus halophilus]|uniref:DUF58 domain-containing protein n=1 Tax=Egicoccus halophilus TaxID=1670830 RepID=A0A8J3AB72_9ACTN|nr:DUF58 domain-containing protein [Egicoccus halophilus]GGI02706.1 hypothetical protein GCM10011354_01270 [Egicoccus halophilus]
MTAPPAAGALLPHALVAQLARHQLTPRRRIRGRYVGGHRSRRLGTSIEFADVREYVAGDDPRRIDLSASRRHGRLQVTLTEAEDDAAAQVVLDRSASMTARKRRTADRLAAALTVLGARDGVRLWLVAHDPATGTDQVTGGWARGPGALAQAGLLLSAGSGTWAGTGRGDRRASADATSAVSTGVASDAADADDGVAAPHDPAGRPDLAAALGRAVRTAATGPLVLVSDLLFDGWDAAVRAAGARDRDVLVLQVLDVEELHPTLTDDVRLVDAETGAQVEVGGDEHTAAAYAAALRAHLDAVAAVCASIGAAHVLVPTDVDLPQLLLAELPALGLVR